MRAHSRGLPTMSSRLGTVLLAMIAAGWNALPAMPASAALSASEQALPADFNGDGYADLVVADDWFGSEITVLFGPDLLPHEGVRFGGRRFSPPALAAGDFNGDGYSDLVIGARRAIVDGAYGAGRVHVIYGSSTGLVREQAWTQNSAGVADSAEPGDNFGSALAVGDFGNGPQDDLAIGASGEDVGSLGSAGAVHVLFGSTSGLRGTQSQYMTQSSPGLAGTAEAGDGFGEPLAAGNLGRSGLADLVVGVTGEDIGSTQGAGAINVLYGSATGLSQTGAQFVSQNSAGIADTIEAGDAFGSTLFAANFGKGTQTDLAIGVPFEDAGPVRDSGVVHILYGASSGLTTTASQLWSQASPGIAGAVEEDDLFGYAVAAGNMGYGTQADLAIGVPGEGIGADPFAGAVNTTFGGQSGLTVSGSQFLHPAAGDFGAALAAGDFDGTGYFELAVGAPAWPDGYALGQVNVMRGTATGPGRVIATLEGREIDQEYGVILR
jgi:FG-GAP repeat protein